MTTLPQTEWQSAMAAEIKRAIEQLPWYLVLQSKSYTCSACGNQTVIESIMEPRHGVHVAIEPDWLKLIDHVPVNVIGVEVEYPYEGGAVEFTVDCKLTLHGTYACEVTNQDRKTATGAGHACTERD